MTRPVRTRRRSLLLVAAVCGTFATGCSTVPDRSAAVEQITAEVNSIPFVESATGRYANGMVEGHSYNIDIRLADSTTPEQLHELAEFYAAEVLAADLAKHSLRLLLRKDDDALRVFARQSLPSWVLEEADRWFDLIDDVTGPIDWAIGPDPTSDVRSITLRLGDRDVFDGPDGIVPQLREHARDLSDRQWIIRWHRTRADLMGTEFPDAATTALVDELTATGEQWSVRYDTTADPPLSLAVAAPGPDRMEETARRHLATIGNAGATVLPVRYTVRANQTPAAEVWVGGCLTGGSELQQRLNAEYGTC